MFMSLAQDARRAYYKNPYAWLFLLIPIAGIVGFYSVEAGENHRRRWVDIRRRKRALGMI